ncbi:hypothetical protein PSD17_38760 [Pseudonocardia sp. D17]|nr:hypothetical protein PSD17_38760 [Pseudonocardia sp. D17]
MSGGTVPRTGRAEIDPGGHRPGRTSTETNGASDPAPGPGNATRRGDVLLLRKCGRNLRVVVRPPTSSGVAAGGLPATPLLPDRPAEAVRLRREEVMVGTQVPLHV